MVGYGAPETPQHDVHTLAAECVYSPVRCNYTHQAISNPSIVLHALRNRLSLLLALNAPQVTAIHFALAIHHVNPSYLYPYTVALSCFHLPLTTSIRIIHQISSSASAK